MSGWALLLGIACFLCVAYLLRDEKYRIKVLAIIGIKEATKTPAAADRETSGPPAVEETGCRASADEDAACRLQVQTKAARALEEVEEARTEASVYMSALRPLFNGIDEADADEDIVQSVLGDIRAPPDGMMAELTAEAAPAAAPAAAPMESHSVSGWVTSYRTVQDAWTQLDELAKEARKGERALRTKLLATTSGIRTEQEARRDQTALSSLEKKSEDARSKASDISSFHDVIKEARTRERAEVEADIKRRVLVVLANANQKMTSLDNEINNSFDVLSDLERHRNTIMTNEETFKNVKGTISGVRASHGRVLAAEGITTLKTAAMGMTDDEKRMREKTEYNDLRQTIQSLQNRLDGADLVELWNILLDAQAVDRTGIDEATSKVVDATQKLRGIAQTLSDDAETTKTLLTGLQHASDARCREYKEGVSDPFWYNLKKTKPTFPLIINDTLHSYLGGVRTKSEFLSKVDGDSKAVFVKPTYGREGRKDCNTDAEDVVCARGEARQGDDTDKDACINMFHRIYPQESSIEQKERSVSKCMATKQCARTCHDEDFLYAEFLYTADDHELLSGDGTNREPNCFCFNTRELGDEDDDGNTQRYFTTNDESRKDTYHTSYCLIDGLPEF